MLIVAKVQCCLRLVLLLVQCPCNLQANCLSIEFGEKRWGDILNLDCITHFLSTKLLHNSPFKCTWKNNSVPRIWYTVYMIYLWYRNKLNSKFNHYFNTSKAFAMHFSNTMLTSKVQVHTDAERCNLLLNFTHAQRPATINQLLIHD